MSDLEERLRTTVARQSMGFVPSAHLPDRIVTRVRRRHRWAQAVKGGLATVAAAATVLVVTLLGAGRDDEGSVRTVDRPDMTVPDQTATPSISPSTTEPPASSATATSSTTAGAADPPATPRLDPLAGLSRHGIGPITAGMTLREAQAAAGVALTPAGSGSGGTCIEAQIDGFDPSIVLVVELTAPGADPMDGFVRAVVGSVLPTDEGAIVGQARSELLAALGQPTRVEDRSAEWAGPAELLVFEAGGYAYGALVVDDLVLGLQSGDPAWVGFDEGCPG